MLNIGILGLGEGRSTISAALQSAKLNLRTICDRDESVCKQRAEEFGFHSYTTKYQDMLNDPAIDIIAIYTPDHLHADHIKLALEHGKHVVCTKPFIDDLSRALELLALQTKTGKRVFVGQSSRFLRLSRQRKDYKKDRLVN
jgi:predicted dehydrogenase